MSKVTGQLGLERRQPQALGSGDSLSPICKGCLRPLYIGFGEKPDRECRSGQFGAGQGPCGQQASGAGSTLPRLEPPTWWPRAGAQAFLGASKGPTLRPPPWRLGLGDGLRAAGPGGAEGSSSGRETERRAS